MAAKFMPKGSIILGIDLLPIRAIRDVKTIVADITTAECRKMVTQELHGWKADVVLCDGAPNIGSAYQKDAYVQNELVLAALKTATEHLIEGGTFCTKVYRSQDYNALVWVLQQLFEEVQPIKPSSSRSQSSEIFLVCTKYSAPNFIDPKLLDPNHVFKEVVEAGTKKVDVLHKKHDQHNKKHRSGYDESLGVLLTRSASVSSFIASKDPVNVLSENNKLVFTDDCTVYLDHPLTTDDIKQYFQDLKLLNRSDFKRIMKWRLKVIESLAPTAPATIVEKEEKKGPLTDADIDEEIQAQREKYAAKLKKDKKHQRELAAKLRTRQALGMTHNSFELVQDAELFALNGGITDDMVDVDLETAEFMDSDEEDNSNDKRLIQLNDADLEDELEEEYVRYISQNSSGRDVLDKVAEESTTHKKRRLAAEPAAIISKNRKDDAELNEEMESYVKLLNHEKESGSDASSSDEDEEESDSDSDAAPAKKARVTRDAVSQSTKVKQWFSHPIFQETVVSEAPKEEKDRKGSRVSLGIHDDDGNAIEMPLTDKEKRKEKRKKVMDKKALKESRVAKEDTSFTVTHVDSDDEHEMDVETAQKRDLIRRGLGAAVDVDDSKMEIAPAILESMPEDVRVYDSDNEQYDNHDRAMTLALGTMMLRKSRQKALVDASYNRYAWNDAKDLPAWFVDDESKHNKPQLPVPAALLEQVCNH